MLHRLVMAVTHSGTLVCILRNDSALKTDSQLHSWTLLGRGCAPHSIPVRSSSQRPAQSISILQVICARASKILTQWFFETYVGSDNAPTLPKLASVGCCTIGTYWNVFCVRYSFQYVPVVKYPHNPFSSLAGDADVSVTEAMTHVSSSLIATASNLCQGFKDLCASLF